jgi:hypothetical protein
MAAYAGLFPGPVSVWAGPLPSSRRAAHLVALLRAVSNRCDNRIMTIARKVVGDD